MSGYSKCRHVRLVREVRTIKENWESGRIETVTASGGIHLGPGKKESPFDRVYAVQKLRGKGENLDVANVLQDGESQFISTCLKGRSNELCLHRIIKSLLDFGTMPEAYAEK